MSYLNDWHDYVRVLAFFMCVYCLCMLLKARRREGGNWNTKTNDYWYAMVMWVLAGHAIAAQGVILDRPFTPAFVFLTAAILTTAKGLHKRGEWGA